ncbi:MAG: hypothetical protein OCC49_02210 [Fibrobacterales bacterium]
MSYEKELQEYHLTPRGWEQGSFNSSSGFHDPVPIPKDRVLTLGCAEERDYGEDPPEYSESTLWKSEEDSSIVILKKEFGDRPNWYGYKKMGIV